MRRRPSILPLSAAIIVLIAPGCSSSRQRADLGGAPAPPAPVYQQPVDRPYQPSYGDYPRPPPLPARPHHTVAGPGRHTVQPGETVYGIARRYNISVAGLIQANHLPSLSLRSGQTLIIPR